jgi:uncharacterized protein YheU (UPF0270 family)
MDIQNSNKETIGTIENGKIIPFEGKEKEVLDNLYSDFVEANNRIQELESNLRVAAVHEKAIRAGLIK